MRFAINVPNSGEYGDLRLLAALAREAAAAGWDGFFVWDHLQFSTRSRACRSPTPGSRWPL